MEIKRASKKGISEIISYVFLISIAIGLSVLVFIYLSKMIDNPKERECDDGISLVIQSATCACDSGKCGLALSVTNKGFFDVSGYIAMMESGGKFRQINKDTELSKPINLDKTLQSFHSLDTVQFTSGNSYILQVKPIMTEDGGKTYFVCGNRIVSYNVLCKASSTP